MDTCIYKVDYQHHSSCSMAFDNMHAIAYVRASECHDSGDRWLLRRELEKKFGIVNSFEKITVVDLAA